jgi:aminopeptidase N
VRAPSAYEVVSNMPRVSRTDEGATALHRFATTPPMPSYLVAVTVGRFDALEGRAAGVRCACSPRPASARRRSTRWK